MSDTESRTSRAEERAARADRIMRVLEEEGLDELLGEWETTLTEKFLSLDSDKDIERYRLSVAITMGRKLKGWLDSFMRDGELARRELKEITSGKRGFY